MKQAIFDGKLHLPDQDSRPGTASQHYKPDLVLVKQARNGELSIRIIDITCGSDDKLIVEEEYTIQAKFKSHKELEAHMISQHFDGDGKPREVVYDKIPEEDRTRAKNIKRFKQAHYSKRYDPLAGVLRNLSPPTRTHVEIRTIAFGVIGWIPLFTAQNLESLLGVDSQANNDERRKYNGLLADIVQTILKFVAKGNRLWLAERH